MAHAAELIATMHNAHGRSEGNRCGDCAHCSVLRVANHVRGTIAVRVCRKADPRVTAHGKVNHQRWATRWQACGLFQATEA